MKAKVERELRVVNNKIEQLEERISSEVEALQKIVNQNKVYDIITFAEDEIRKIKEHNSKMEMLVEQRDMLMFLIEK